MMDTLQTLLKVPAGLKQEGPPIAADDESKPQDEDGGFCFCLNAGYAIGDAASTSTSKRKR